MVKKEFKIEEVAVALDISTGTLNRWYKFKRSNPKHELSRQLPDPQKIQTLRGWARVWNKEDINTLKNFRDSVTKGRDGLMGKYDGKGTKNAKKEN